jgi:ribosome-binding factor A
VTQRTERIDELLRQEIGAIVSRELGDPRVGFATITSVETTPDLRHAKVWVSVIGQVAERTATIQMVLHDRGHPRDDLLDVRRRQRLHLDHVPQHGRSHELGRREFGPQFRVRQVELVGDAAQQLGGDEPAENGGGGLVVHGGADDREDRQAGRRVLPDAEDEAGQALPYVLQGALRECVGGAQGGGGGDLHGRLEDLLLGAEVVVDQSRVDPGGLGDPAHGRLLVAPLGELLPGRDEDPVPGTGRVRFRTPRPATLPRGDVTHGRGAFWAAEVLGGGGSWGAGRVRGAGSGWEVARARVRGAGGSWEVARVHGAGGSSKVARVHGAGYIWKVARVRGTGVPGTVGIRRAAPIPRGRGTCTAARLPAGRGTRTSARIPGTEVPGAVAPRTAVRIPGAAGTRTAAWTADTPGA